MLKTWITIGCTAAMLAALVLAVRLRRTQWKPSPLSGTEPFRERLAVTTSRSAGMLLGAVAAGVLTLGAGSRLMMRVLAATSSDGVQGALTEAEEVVGEVSVGGSAFLILGVGIGTGAVGLALFSLLRRWLPAPSLVAGWVGVALGAGLLVRPSGLLNSTNPDFRILTPVALAVALCLAILALFGATFGVLVDHLASHWPRPGWTPKGVASVLPFALLIPAPPLFVATLLAVLAGAVVAGQRSQRQIDGGGARAGQRLVLGLGGLGALSVVAAAGQVLAL